MSFQQSQKTQPMGNSHKARLAESFRKEATREEEVNDVPATREEQQSTTATMQ